jgi:hypothetical protein
MPAHRHQPGGPAVIQIDPSLVTCPQTESCSRPTVPDLGDRAPAVGDVLRDSYELRRELERHPSWTVFEARHRHTGRALMVKVGTRCASRALRRARARILREAQVLGRIRHPGALEVHDAGLLARGIPYLVTEKVEGRALEGVVAERGRLSREDVVAIGLQLCEVLEHAHLAGVVHGNVRLASVMVCHLRAGQERIKLLGFGAEDGDARRPSARPTDRATFDDAVDAVDPGVRDDLYGVGVTLFECLADRVPHAAMPGGAGLLHTSDVVAIGAHTGPKLASVLARALAPWRADAFTSAAELGHALRSVLDRVPAGTRLLDASDADHASPPSGAPHPWRLPDRRRAPRVPHAGPARLVSDRGVVEARTEDISECGLLVVTRDPGACAYEPGTRVQIGFTLPVGGETVTTDAEVRWVRASTHGAGGEIRAVGLELVAPPAHLKASVRLYLHLRGVDVEEKHV